MGTCCSFLKRSEYRDDAKFDQNGYRNASISSTQKNFKDISIKENNSKNNANEKNSSDSNNYRFINNDGNQQNGFFENNKSDDGNLSLPHIADFYPEENSNVPADNPRTGTLFLPKADCEKHNKKIYNQQAYNSSLANDIDQANLNKCSSCSTIYIDDSTVSQPNLKWAIRLVAYAIHYHIKRRTSDRCLDIFDEKLYPLSNDFKVPVDYATTIPDHRLIYKFMKNLFTSAQLTSECAIVSLIYLERVLTYAEIDLCPSSWKRLLLGSILLASKVWDDQAVWNIDICQILKDIKVDNMNELEREYLVLMQFNINVPSSVYAKYYFDLRKLDEDASFTYSRKRLTKEKACKLETFCSVNHEKSKEYLHFQQMRRTSSANNVKNNSNSFVILS